MNLLRDSNYFPRLRFTGYLQFNSVLRERRREEQSFFPAVLFALLLNESAEEGALVRLNTHGVLRGRIAGPLWVAEHVQKKTG